MKLDLTLNPYLFGCGLLLAFWMVTLAVVWKRPTSSNWREFWWGSFVCSLMGFTEPLFVPEYWHPPSILSYGRWDFESFIFCFAIGGISAVAPEWRPIRTFFESFDRLLCRPVSAFLRWLRPFTGTAATASVPPRVWTKDERQRENTLVAAMFLGFFGCTAHLGLNIIYDAALTCVGVAAYLAWRRPDVRWQVWAGGFTFTIVYAAVLRGAWLYDQEFYTKYWNLPALSGRWLLDAPIEEYLFAATFGVFWAPFFEAWRNERGGKPAAAAPVPVAVALHPPNNQTYSQATRHHGLLYLSGQLGIDPATKQLVPGGLPAETRQALENISAILQAAGSSLDRVARVNIYIADFTQLPAMNQVYAEYFRLHKPAKTTVEIARLDKNAAIEIEVIAAC